MRRWTNRAAWLIGATLLLACSDDGTDGGGGSSSATSAGGGTPASSSSSSSSSSSGGGEDVTSSSSSGGGAGGAGGSGAGGSGTGGSGVGGAGGGATGAGGAGGATGAGGAGGATGAGGAGGGMATGAGGAGGGMATGAGGAGGMATGAGGAGGGMPECVDDTDCDTDGVTCSVDVCNNGVCEQTLDHMGCDDNLFCTGLEACVPGVAEADPTTGCVSAGAQCDDGVGCTQDSCDENADSCVNAPTNSLCDDNVACTTDTCDAVNDCQFVVAQGACDDGLDCTVDSCSFVTGQCAHQENDAVCASADNNLCDGLAQCDANASSPGTGCVENGPPVDCDDGIACTTDSCNPANGTCSYVADDGQCDDNLFCNGAETCQIGTGCVAGTAPNCNDGVNCTADSCNETTDSCDNVGNDAACENGLACDGIRVCDEQQGCVLDTPAPDCDDGFSCTIDSCTNPGGSCNNVPSNALCPGAFCSPTSPGANGTTGCVAAEPCTNDNQCDDGNDCNGIEVCAGAPNGTCAPDPDGPVDCDDGNDCTLDECDPGDGTCSNIGFDEVCDDGLACNGVETCDDTPMTGGCVNGPAPSCNDGIACTVDTCSEPSGTCNSNPNSAACGDGLFCNGVETCNPTMGCMPGVAQCTGAAPGCLDSFCSEQTDACVTVPDSSECNVATGQTCDANGVCQACIQKTCQGKVYACGDCTDNDADGLADENDPDCLGPCDNTEDSYFGGIPGQNNSPCKSDCYFDQDTGAGNDDCYWSHKCDPLEVTNNGFGQQHPEDGCNYNPGASIPGYGGTCAQAFTTQSSGAPDTCLGYCGPLVPNGCDCFGCCDLPGINYSVWLGSNDGSPACDIDNIDDPDICRPCTQVPACLNTCENCEICIGKPTLPPECTEQECPVGAAPCGQPGQAACGAGEFCISGCCQDVPT